MRILTIIMITFFISGLSLKVRREENDKIQKIIRESQILNQRPSPQGSPRAARIARNRYQNQLDPIYPKTIYREFLPTRHFKRFAGGIPR